MANAMIGYDTLYEVWDEGASPAAFVAVSEVFAFTPGEATADRIDVTHYKSPGRRREYISGLIDSGEASFEMNYVPGSDSDRLILGLLASGEVVEHRVTFPNGARLTFDASVIGYARTAPVDDRMTATVTVAVSGDETWDDAS